MTYNEAQTSRNIYVLLSFLAFALGIFILLVTGLKAFWLGFACGAAQHQNCLGNESFFIKPIRSIKDAPVVSWLWPWISESGFGGTSNPLLFPSTIVAFTLVFVGYFLRQNAAKLNKWMREVRELLAVEQMANSRRPPQSRQSIGDVHVGRDSNITQQITNHYNHRPDNPKAPIIVTIIGAIATIAAALMRN
jgi:hypothetical protein